MCNYNQPLLRFGLFLLQPRQVATIILTFALSHKANNVTMWHEGEASHEIKENNKPERGQECVIHFQRGATVAISKRI